MSKAVDLGLGLRDPGVSSLPVGEGPGTRARLLRLLMLLKLRCVSLERQLGDVKLERDIALQRMCDTFIRNQAKEYSNLYKITPSSVSFQPLFSFAKEILSADEIASVCHFFSTGNWKSAKERPSPSKMGPCLSKIECKIDIPAEDVEISEPGPGSNAGKKNTERMNEGRRNQERMQMGESHLHSTPPGRTGRTSFNGCFSSGPELAKAPNKSSPKWQVLVVPKIGRSSLGELRSYKNRPPDSIIQLWTACLLILGRMKVEDAKMEVRGRWRLIQKLFVDRWRNSEKLTSHSIAFALTSGTVSLNDIGREDSLKAAKKALHKSTNVEWCSRVATGLEAWVRSVLSQLSP